jgi:hypothetical protein
VNGMGTIDEIFGRITEVIEKKIWFFNSFNNSKLKLTRKNSIISDNT